MLGYFQTDFIEKLSSVSLLSESHGLSDGHQYKNLIVSTNHY